MPYSPQQERINGGLKSPAPRLTKQSLTRLRFSAFELLRFVLGFQRSIVCCPGDRVGVVSIETGRRLDDIRHAAAATLPHEWLEVSIKLALVGVFKLRRQGGEVFILAG
jgi:hypothetical protein